VEIMQAGVARARVVQLLPAGQKIFQGGGLQGVTHHNP